MPLHLAHHKSYHPYSKLNIEKVKKDEEIQEELDRIQSNSVMAADSEARLILLRRQRDQLQSGKTSSSSKRGDRLKAAESQVLEGKKGELEKWDQSHKSRVGIGAAADSKEPSSASSGKGKGKERHINFWSDLEVGDSKPNRNSTTSRNLSNLKDEADAQLKFQERILGKSAELHPWYQDSELKNGQEKKKTMEQQLEAAYKDSTIKSSHDPLKAMSGFLAQRQVALGLQEGSSSSSRVPSHSISNSKSSRWDNPSSTSTSKGSDSASKLALREAASARETSEKARAEALIASRIKKLSSSSSSISETTPYQSHGNGRNDYSDQFHGEDVRAARRNRWEKEEKERRSDLAGDQSRGLHRNEDGRGNREGASFDLDQQELEVEDLHFEELHLSNRNNSRSNSAPPPSSILFPKLPSHDLNLYPRRASVSLSCLDDDWNSFTIQNQAIEEQEVEMEIEMGEKVKEKRKEEEILPVEMKIILLGIDVQDGIEGEEMGDEKMVDAERSGSNSRDDENLKPTTTSTSTSNQEGGSGSNPASTSHSEFPSTNTGKKRAFSEDEDEDQEEGDDSNQSPDTSMESQMIIKESMYPTLLGQMISTVLEAESFLFSPQEIRLLKEFLVLPYESRYLFSLLIQRKTRWFRVQDIKFSKDLTDVETAVENLCAVLDMEEEAMEIDEADHNEEVDYIQDPDLKPLSSFTITEQALEGDARGILILLKLDELRVLARDMGRIKGNNKKELIEVILATKNQTTLFSSSSKSNSTGAPGSSQSPSKDGKRQLQLNFKPTSPTKASSFSSTSKKDAKWKGSANKTQGSKIVESAARILGGLVGLRPSVRSLIDRIALIYYRGGSLGAQALTTMVLAHCRKRNYPKYTHSRSPNLFPSRNHLIAFERALKIELKVDDWVEQDGSEEALRKGVELLDQVWEEWESCVKECQDLNQGQDKMEYHKMRFHAGWILTRIVYKSAHCLGRFKMYEKEKKVLHALLDQKVFRRGRRGAWYDRLALIYSNYSDFGLTIEREKNKAKAKGRQEALKICVQGIEDPDTHLIYHDTLQKRIARLENQLSLPFSEKHDFSYSKLKECGESHFQGVRLDEMIYEDEVESPGTLFKTSFFSRTGSESRQSTPLESPTRNQVGALTVRAPLRKRVRIETIKTQASPLRSAGLSRSDSVPIGEEEAIPIGISLGTAPYPPNPAFNQPKVQRTETRKSMHSVWRGDDGEPCRVEQLVLQRYAERGFRGYHCEGSVLMMLFTLLMWDVVYAPVEGAFETEYQREPLDMREDSFSIARSQIIQQRLREIESGSFLSLIYESDQANRHLKTFALACRWDDYPLRDLLEVAQCLGGQSLSFLCQMLSEEWGHCTSGMPDLLIWKLKEEKNSKAEVGDSEIIDVDAEEEQSFKEVEVDSDGKGKARELEGEDQEASAVVTREELESISRRKGRAKFCEVKGPGDKLSDKQKVWIDVLLRANAEIEVGYVEEEVKKATGKGKGKKKK